jgi:hypothetical protein
MTMKRSIVIAGLLAAAAAAAPYASAKTASGTIPESANIVPGNTFSAFLVGGEIVTVTGAADSAQTLLYHGLRPIIRIDFETKRDQYFVTYVTWDKAHHKLDINF